jgi:hypothetical protein
MQPIAGADQRAR